MGGYYYSDETVRIPYLTFPSLYLWKTKPRTPPKNAFSERGFEMLVCIHECPLYCKIERGNFPKRKTLLEHVNFKTTFHVHTLFRKIIFQKLRRWCSSNSSLGEMLSYVFPRFEHSFGIGQPRSPFERRVKGSPYS